MTAPPLVGCVVWSHPQGLGRYIVGTTEGHNTDDLQGSREIDINYAAPVCIELQNGEGIPIGSFSCNW